MRRTARSVKAGKLFIGGTAPVAVQSMLSVPAKDLEGNVRQARQLEEAGCEILRVSVPTLEDVRLLPVLRAAVSVPLVADIHFDYRIALASVDAGADKIRLNPGNIGGDDKVKAVAKACMARGVPIRVGVNGGSLPKDILAKYGGPVPAALVETALWHIGLLERQGFGDIVVSLKSSHVPTSVEAYRLLAQKCDYPLHLGVTEAGGLRAGIAKNALGIGLLLMEGIGDTLRVSLTADPLNEVAAGFDILRAAGLAARGAEIISCPTCGRTSIPVAEIAAGIEQRLAGRKAPLKVAVMGCVVNGLGEGKEADIGIAGGKESAVLFVKGRQLRTLRGGGPGLYIEELLKEIAALPEEL